MEIKVVSHLNYDGYYLNGTFYTLGDIDALVEQIDSPENIVWVKGNNTFTGNPVGDKFFERMKEKVLQWFEQIERRKIMENMILIMVDECGDEVEVDRFYIGDELDEDYIEMWQWQKIDKAYEHYPEAQRFYFEDRRNWNSMINAMMWEMQKGE